MVFNWLLIIFLSVSQARRLWIQRQPSSISGWALKAHNFFTTNIHLQKPYPDYDMPLPWNREWQMRKYQYYLYILYFFLQTKQRKNESFPFYYLVLGIIDRDYLNFWLKMSFDTFYHSSPISHSQLLPKMQSFLFLPIRCL